MNQYVLFFEQINHVSLPLVGGKGANLGEMTQAGFPVPGGFCVTTDAYKDFIATSPEMGNFFVALATIDPTKLDRLRELSERIRAHLQQLPMPAEIHDAIIQAWMKRGAGHSYAIRSSATAEDLPSASFAGQQDTYLNIKGREDLLLHVRKCWASLFTDRAIAYRAKNGFDHQEVYLSIVIQQMVIPEISGILFTAEPVSGNRTVVSIDASFGLGEALVSGLVSADLYKVKNDTVISKKISQKKVAIYSLTEGGTITKELPPEQQEKQVLTDQQIIALAALGKKIEQHYGNPQDIEFCMANGEFSIVQSRPITTLYPLSDIPQHPLRVLLSFGHVQMATDAMKPLGLSMLRTLFPANFFKEAGGRIFIDITDLFHNKMMRMIFPKLLTNADEAMSRAVKAIVKRPEFLKKYQSINSKPLSAVRKVMRPVMGKAWTNLRSGDSKIGKFQVKNFTQERFEQTRQALARVQGAERIKAVQRQMDSLLPEILDRIIPYVAPGIIAGVLLKKIIGRRFKDTVEFNRLNKSLPGNVTSEMGLELGDLADRLREFPAVQEYLKTAGDQTFYAGFYPVPGGKQFRQAFETFIGKYGMRCPGEIDLTNPRWHEAPTQLVAALFSHIRSLKPGEHRQRFVEGEREAETASRHILNAVSGNYFKTKLITRLIAVFRNMGGLREQHKYLLIMVMGECKKAIMAEATGLVQKGVLAQAEDVYFLSLEELAQLLEGDLRENVSELIARRKEEYRWHQSLKPPRVMTSEGEIVVVPARKGPIPEGTLIGSPVSAGVAEGIARVILKPENAVLNEGEILVAPHTDPGWTPLFQSAIAIITEVGGLMTHGAVVAREYGIPAVAGVDDATTLIKDGQKIRVDGVQGVVEILEPKLIDV
ncbi:phosphoenolpyruvate synthase [Sporomusa sp. KB1]|jgi:pyruvate,water dikinase|uniref:phosphoenolpyruvate synthase n=1 Tax=Sporomusa sp. KB1 TaxID=943346 RepID=UPI0011A45D71|nr:phosphoenolpyruvate synthase [Sporomusa sp. KB1]TWH52132.1 pyruvate,water dikinase [Sporomusa sp. KB1]